MLPACRLQVVRLLPCLTVWPTLDADNATTSPTPYDRCDAKLSAKRRAVLLSWNDFYHVIIITGELSPGVCRSQVRKRAMHVHPLWPSLT